MKKEDIHITDWKRILLGDAPPEYLLEILGRSLLIYVALLVVVRLMGKRMSGQLTITEMSVIITLGAVIAPPMHLPDKGLIAPIVILVIFFLVHQLLNYWSVKKSESRKRFRAMSGFW